MEWNSGLKIEKDRHLPQLLADLWGCVHFLAKYLKQTYLF
jgi:hypothetical protein